MSAIDDRIQQAFERAASTYDEHAVLQKQVAAGVEQLCLQHCSQADCKAILDIGAGTGFVTLPLLYQYASSHVTALDISHNMLRSIPEHTNLKKVQADFMALPFAAASFDLLVSSLALQWAHDLSQLFASLARLLKPQGKLVFSTLLSDSLFELRNSWQSIDQFPHVNRFASKAVLQSCFAASGFAIEVQRQEKMTLYYDSVTDILHSLKGIGANTVIARTSQTLPQQGLGGRKRLQALAGVYEKYRKEAGLPLSYSVYWLVLRKTR